MFFNGETSNYVVYSSYYSQDYDTLYISYDSKDNPIQTINSKQLALIEEHLLRYFVSDSAKSDYQKYLKVVRIYPDYKSSTCRDESHTQEQYSSIEGCANYNASYASIDLNSLINIERFFKPYSYTSGNYIYTIEPKRDTFAHEFGHVSTYYNMILKGDGSYKEYLQLRLKDAYDTIYPLGLPDEYSENEGYYYDPLEILADDYVELFYDTSEKANNDYYDYDLEYNDLRNSLSTSHGVIKHLKDDANLFDEMKSYYSLYIEKDYLEYETPIVVNATGDVYASLHSINEENSLSLNEATIIALGEVEVDGTIYYRVVLSNLVNEINYRKEYSNNIGYIAKDNCLQTENEVIFFEKYDGNLVSADKVIYLTISDMCLLPLYDFSYLIVEGLDVKIYNYLTPGFEIALRSKSLFS